MNKRYLPVIAAFLIAVTCTAFLPVFAQLPTYVYVAPTLSITTIAQGDQLRGTGIILFAASEAAYATALKEVGPTAVLMTQYKVLVAYNGQPVAPNSWSCVVIEKDKVNPIKNKQFLSENLYTNPVDASGNFVCKFRYAEPGVYVLDLYYVGSGLPASIADYVLVVDAAYNAGRSTVYGTDMQDVCLLAWPLDGASSLAAGPTAPDWIITKPDGTLHRIFADPLNPFRSCEDAALFEKAVLLVPISWS